MRFLFCLHALREQGLIFDFVKTLFMLEYHISPAETKRLTVNEINAILFYYYEKQFKDKQGSNKLDGT